MSTEPDPLPPFSEIFGASIEALQCIRLYLPNRDRNKVEIANIDEWVERACEVLTRANGGATALSGLRGMWEDHETGEIINETTVVVYSYISESQRFLENIGLIIRFVHNFGRRTNQGEVFIEFDDEAWKIREFYITD